MGLKDILPMPPGEGPPFPRGFGQRWPGEGNSDLEKASKIIRNLITDMEETITTSKDPVEVSALKGVVYFMEDNWDDLMNEINSRLKT